MARITVSLFRRFGMRCFGTDGEKGLPLPEQSLQVSYSLHKVDGRTLANNNRVGHTNGFLEKHLGKFGMVYGMAWLFHKRK